MQLSRRAVFRLTAGAVALPAVTRVARAQSYPSRPVRIIVGFGPGGANDITARLIGQWLSERLGQPFVIENRSGAGGNLATDLVVKAPPDGYTLLSVGPGAAINATLYDNLTFNFARDIALVAPFMRAPNLLALNPSVPAKTIPELIVYAKANPGKLSMSSPGNGTAPQMVGELFKMMAGVDIVHVPHRSAAPALADLLGGQVQMSFVGPAASIELLKTGKLRGLAVTTTMRSEVLPDIPTMGEFLPGYEASQWYGIGAPRQTPPDIVEKLNREINLALADAKIRARIFNLGGTVFSGTSGDFAKLIEDEAEKWGKVIRAANIKPQ